MQLLVCVGANDCILYYYRSGLACKLLLLTQYTCIVVLL